MATTIVFSEHSSTEWHWQRYWQSLTLGGSLQSKPVRSTTNAITHPFGRRIKRLKDSERAPSVLAQELKVLKKGGQILTVILLGVVRCKILKNLAEKQHLLIRFRGRRSSHSLLIKISRRGDMYKYRGVLLIIYNITII